MKVFLSSTCYESRDPRAVLERWLRDQGHEPLLSDRPSFPVSLNKHRHDICVQTAAAAEAMILVIEPRFGAPYHRDSSISITWAEFRAASQANVPIIVFIRTPIFDERKTWKKNAGNIVPAHCDNPQLFNFIDEVQKHPQGYWIETHFSSVVEIVERLEAVGGIVKLPFWRRGHAEHLLLSAFTDDTRAFVSRVTGKTNADDKLTRDDIERCLLRIPDTGYVGILVIEEMVAESAGHLIVHDRIRPAEDDGGSWYCATKLSDKGHRISQELNLALNAL